METRSRSNRGVPFTQPCKDITIKLALASRLEKANRVLHIAEALGLAPSAGMSASTDLGAIDQLVLNRMN
jgi:hypothetical protein